MSKKRLTEVIQSSMNVTGVAAGKLAVDIVQAIKDDLVSAGRFTLWEFGSFVVRETPKRTAFNPRTGDKVQVKAGATVRFKPSPALKTTVSAAVKKVKRKLKASEVKSPEVKAPEAKSGKAKAPKAKTPKVKASKAA